VRRTLIIGAAYGGGVGIIFGTGYIIAAFIFCNGQRSCPTASAPFWIIFALIVVGFAIASALIGVVLRAVYNKYYKDGV